MASSQGKKEKNTDDIPDSKPLEKKNKNKLSKIASYFGMPVVLLALIIIISVLGPTTDSPCLGDFSLSNLASAASEKACPSNLFAEPVKNFVREPLDVCLIQENSLIAVSAPNIITSKSLGIFIGEEIEEERQGVIEYTVGPDDSISSIAEKFNISVDTILWANGLSSKSSVKAGQTLVILPVSGVLYFVEEGDTLETIAKAYKGDTREIISFNGLKGEEDIYIGDVLVIPNGKIVPKAESPSIKQVPLVDSYFIIPVEGRITQKLHFYNAIDIANSCGKPVVAAAGGKVQRAGWVNIGGNAVTILHPNGVVTYYGHLSTITVVPGQVVATGEIIGYVGKTGYATGCHVHFEVRGATNFMAKYPLGSTVKWGN